MEDILIFIMEIIGTIAFSASGALVAVQCSLDLFGVMFLGSITAVGGGVLRDMFLGKHPPSVFSNAVTLPVAVGVSIIVFIIAYCNRKRLDLIFFKIEQINRIFDAIGLSVFSVMGVEIACIAQDGAFEKMAFFVIFMGMTTGVGGGLLRDVMVSKPPYVLTKHIYAVASLAGSALYYILRFTAIPVMVQMGLPMLFVVVIRAFSSKYRWSLPKIKL